MSNVSLKSILRARLVLLVSIGLFLVSSLVSLLFDTALNPSITRGFAVETVGIGVFWDENRTENVDSIDWGILHPGSTKDVTLYVWNGMNVSVFLHMRTAGFAPVNASEFISVWLHRECASRSIAPDEVMNVTLTIRISPYVTEITDFGINIMFSGLSRPPSDINQDGKVDIRDIAIVACAYGSISGDPNWNSLADTNEDGKIDIHDIAFVTQDFGLVY